MVDVLQYVLRPFSTRRNFPRGATFSFVGCAVRINHISSTCKIHHQYGRGVHDALLSP